jgi:hypothetical protein
VFASQFILGTIIETSAGKILFAANIFLLKLIFDSTESKFVGGDVSVLLSKESFHGVDLPIPKNQYSLDKN